MALSYNYLTQNVSEGYITISQTFKIIEVKFIWFNFCSHFYYCFEALLNELMFILLPPINKF